MTKYLSRKIKFISLFLMIGVVFVHAYNYSDSFLKPTTTISEGFNLGAMFEYFISNGLARFAVPMFFAISGYLFYYTFRPSIKCYKYKLKSRFFSLVIPFVIWCVISGLFLFILSCFDSSPWHQTIMEMSKNIQQNGFMGVLNWFINPPAFQLWYLQQLIIFTVISPIIYWLVKYSRGIIIILAALVWLTDFSYIINSEALLFFMCGAFIAIFDKESFILQKESRLFTVIISLAWILVCVIKTILAAFDEGNSAFMYITKMGLSKASCILGIIAMWLLFDHIVKRFENKKGMLLLTGHMFFIYTIHEPLLHVCTQFGIGAGAPGAAHIALYLCLPISIIAFSVILSMCVRKLCLPLHKVLTGNRSN